MESVKNVNTENVEEASQVQIADDVIAVIAEIASLEVEGASSIGAKKDIVKAIRGKKATKGIAVEVIENEVFIDVMCTLKYGVKIQDVCLKIQEKVKNSIETMTGLHVKRVDVQVVGVEFPKTKIVEEY